MVDALAKGYDNSMVDALAKSYEDSVAAGREFIHQRWREFGQQTEEWLTASGHFNERGKSQILEPAERSDDIERLEFDLGVLQRCVNATLPSRGKTDALIPAEALNYEVLSAAASMMYGNRSHEPAFLRFALAAIRMHQMANLLTHLHPEPVLRTLDGVYRLLGAVLALIFVLASPGLVGLAITSAAQGDGSAAALAFYGVALALLFAWYMKNLDKDTALTPHEVAYHDWLMLGVGIGVGAGPWLAGGAGTAAYLENMMRKGAKVPPIAFDLCAMLTARITR